MMKSKTYTLVCSRCGKEAEGNMKCCPNELCDGIMESSYEYRKRENIK